MKISFNREIDLKYDVDVFIAGGGPAGAAAAVAAAENGASVFIAESFGAFGGAAVNALVPAFMQFTDGENFVADGIGRRVRDFIRENCPEKMKKYCPDSIPVETLKLCYDNMIESSGAKFAFFTDVIGTVVENGSVKYAVCSTKGSIYAVKAKIFIDGTGDGDMAAMSGAEYKTGDENGSVMAATLCALWTGIDWKRVVRPDSRKLDAAFKDGVFTNEDRHLPGIWPIGDDIGGSNAGHIYNVDGCDGNSLTKGMVEARKQLLEYRRYYRNYLEGYENSEPVISASMLGIRESRRITGGYILNVDDFLNRAVFDDEIGRYCYPIDIHSAQNTKEGYEEYAKSFASLRYKKGESYGIPYRSLTVKGISNMLTAGRCISTDRSMQASVRVMPGCFITGQAAGAAAAQAALTGTACADIDIKRLQRSLKDLGAYLPNAVL